MKITVSLPTADLEKAFAFYRDGLGFTVVGAAGDEMPEPVRFALNAETVLMLVPTTGFGWVLAGNQVATPGVSECALGLTAATEAEVDAIIAKARAASATIAAEPAAQRWGYSAAFRDLDGHTWLVVKQS